MRQKIEINVLENGQLCQVPFNSANKYALTIVKIHTDTSEDCLFMKGASEIIWQHCSAVLMSQGRTEQIDEHWN